MKRYNKHMKIEMGIYYGRHSHPRRVKAIKIIKLEKERLSHDFQSR